MKKKTLLSLTIFLLLILIIIMDNALLLPNEVLIAADLGILFDSIGILIGIYTIIHGVSILTFGYLTDKFPRKNLLILSGAIWSIDVMLYVFITNFWQLLLARIIAAIATGITAPLVISYLSDFISADSRSKSFAFWGLLSTFSGLFAGVLALSFNTINFSTIASLSINEKIAYITLNYPADLYTWKFPYLYLGMIAFILTILNFFFTVEPKRGAKDKAFQDILLSENLQYSYKIKFSDLKYIFKRRVIILLVIAIVFGLFVGQFGLAHWGDKKVKKGDLNGRVKVATICSILTLPFLLAAFAMAPNAPSQTFFFGSLYVNDLMFSFLWIVFSVLLGLGLAFTMGIGPNWYSSLIDVNFPENRGTMIAAGSFIDTIGRALGAVIGGFMVTITESFSSTIFWSTLIFGILSIFLWIPLFFTSKADFEAVNAEMERRAREFRGKIS
jgi:MFS family permease